MITASKQWTCDDCKAIEMQTGSRALELLPTPPIGWILQDTTRTLPERIVGDAANKVKMGESRETTRRSFCSACAPRRMS